MGQILLITIVYKYIIHIPRISYVSAFFHTTHPSSRLAKAQPNLSPFKLHPKFTQTHFTPSPHSYLHSFLSSSTHTQWILHKKALLHISKLEISECLQISSLTPKTKASFFPSQIPIHEETNFEVLEQ